MSPIALRRSDTIEEAPTATPWIATTWIAIGASIILLIALGCVAILFYRRRRSFQLGHRERASIAQITWSPVTTLNSTPFASHNNSPMRICPWEKSGYSGSSGSRIGSFYTATSDTAPSSPCALLRSKLVLNIQPEIGDGKGEKETAEEREADREQERWELKRSISPLDLTPHLARLPSVKAGSTNRVSDIIRGSMLLGRTDWEAQRKARRETVMSGITLSDMNIDDPIQTPTITARMSGVLDRRSALFSVHELQSLFQDRKGGAPARASTESGAA